MNRKQFSRIGLNSFDRRLSVIFGILVLAGFLTAAVLSALPQNVEKYTQFYMLGINGQAADYPKDFTLENGRISEVRYGDSATVFKDQKGKLTLGIVNNEGHETTYILMMQEDGSPLTILFHGNSLDYLGPFTLAPDEKWEEEIGIAPLDKGDKQELDMLLYKDGSTEPCLNLYLLINVK